MKYIVRLVAGGTEEFGTLAEAEDFCRRKWPKAVISSEWEPQGYVKNPSECLWVWKNAEAAEGPYNWGNDGTYACAVIIKKP